jgi:hypothetical protein
MELAKGSTIIDAEFIATIQQTAQALVQAAAEINNKIRLIERTCEHADDETLKMYLEQLRTISGDLSMQWGDLDSMLAAYDLSDPR